MTESSTSARNGPRRAELGRFLKARRSQVHPEDVGLPSGPRRRTAGLRREEVALLAGVGVTWYTWLEQGRPINASAQVLDAVAGTLRLDRAGREHLYQLADLMPQRHQTNAIAIPDALRHLLRSLDPLPAVLLNTRYDVIEYNDAHEHLFWYWHSLPCLHRNLLWCCVTEPKARECLLNYDEEVRHIVARFRSAYGKHVGDREWEEDIRRLSELSPEFTELWALHEVAEPLTRRRILRHPAAGRLTFTVTELDVSAIPDLRIQVQTPDDQRTWARLPDTRLPDRQAGRAGA